MAGGRIIAMDVVRSGQVPDGWGWGLTGLCDWRMSGFEARGKVKHQNEALSFFYLKGVDGGMAPAAEVEWTWVARVCRENRELGIDHL